MPATATMSAGAAPRALHEAAQPASPFASPMVPETAGRANTAPDALHVLVVEDDKIDAWLMSEALRDSEHVAAISYASDGQEAIEQIEAGMKPDVMIVDLNMPRMGGLDLLTQLGDGSAASCPVIVLTSSRVSEDAYRSYRRGAWIALTKPRNPQRYRDILDETLGQLRASEEGRPSRNRFLRTRFANVRIAARQD